MDVHDHGFVRLVDHMPLSDLDASIVQAARVSYAAGTKSTSSDRGLIRYLLRHWHTTPFEMVEFKFHIKMPIFVARQHLRHRTASVNELSARYSVVPDQYYEPVAYRQQSHVNKQGSEGDLDIADDLKDRLVSSKAQAFEVYEKALESGCSRELARCHLPQSTYTEFYWKINLHNLMHYLQLRMESGAQEEIRDYANAIYGLVKPLVPITMEAFMDFRVNALQLSGPEIEAIKTASFLESPGENREFLAKMARLGLSREE